MFLLSPPPPPWLFSPFHSANINRVIWKSRVVENLTELRLWKRHLHDKLLQFNSQLRLGRWDVFHAPNKKELLFFQGLFYRVVHHSAISSCTQVINSGVMSIYSSSYCRLPTWVTGCDSLYWWAVLHLHSYGTKQLNQWLEHDSLVSTFTSPPRCGAHLCICVSGAV